MTRWEEMQRELEYSIAERAAIMEFDGGLTREEAQKKAAEYALAGIAIPPDLPQD